MIGVEGDLYIICHKVGRGKTYDVICMLYIYIYIYIYNIHITDIHIDTHRFRLA